MSGLLGFKPQYAIGGVGGATVAAVSLVAARPLGVAGVVSLRGRRPLVIIGVGGPAGVVWRCAVGLTPGRLAGVMPVAVARC